MKAVPPVRPGQVETDRLVFRGRDALADLDSLGRFVAAMLNGRGGSLWIGVPTGGGRVSGFEPVGDPEREQRRLRDHLVDALEPVPSGKEVGVTVEPCPGSAGGSLLHLAIRPVAGRKPYALLRGGDRRFLLRTGNRVRPMGREEIRDAFRRGPARSGSAGAAVRALDRRRADLRGPGADRFWIRLQPEAGRIGADPRDPAITGLLQEPVRAGARPLGWNVANPQAAVRTDRRGWIQGGEESGRLLLERGGALEFLAPMNRLEGADGPRWVYPLALLELTATAFRLAARSLEIHGLLEGADLTLTADLEFFHAGGWRLAPFSPRSLEHGFAVRESPLALRPPATLEGPEAVGAAVRRPFTASDLRMDLRDSTDRCAYLLLARVYDALGLGRDGLPSELDPETLRLVL